MPESPTVDSPDSAPSLRAALEGFDAGARHRGALYHRTRRVAHLARTADDTVTATVRGTHRYTVHLVREGISWQNDCSCPLNGDCKHVFATALAWLDQLARKTTTPSTPPASVSFAPPPAASKLPRTTATFVELQRPILERKLARPLETHEIVFLGKISQLFHSFQETGGLWSHELARLGFPTRESQRGPYQQAFKDWWDSPPRTPLELWQYVAHDIESSGLAIPEFIQPLTDTSSARHSLTNRLRSEAITRWTQRFETLLATAASPPEASATRFLDLRLRVTRDKWALEARSSIDAPWKSATRTFLEQLSRESTQLSALDASPAVFAFLAICQEHYRKHYTIALSPTDAASRQLLHRLLSHRLAHELVTGTEGTPLAFSEHPLIWRIETSPEEATDYLIALARADGRPLSPGAIHLPGKPDLYLEDGLVFRGPPALAGLSTSTAIVPAEVIERPDILGTLYRLGTRLPEKFAERFASVPLRPCIECQLENSLPGQELLSIDLLAVSSTPPARQRWSPTGWLPATAKKSSHSSPDDTRILLLDHTAAEKLTTHLTQFGLVYNQHDQRWTRRVSKTFAEDFLAWRSSLPAEVEVLATGELSSLLAAPVRARVEFELLESNVHRDWFDLALALRPEDSTLTKSEIALLLKARGKFVRLEGKGWQRLEVLYDETTTNVLHAAGFDSASLTEAAAAGERHRLHTLQLNQTGIAELLPEQQSVALRSRAREIARPEPPPIPTGLRAELRTYQREGFHFLTFLSINGLGGVLADDMGLGKTLQTLAWLLWLAERQPAGEPLRALVVCPKSVVSNWESETARFAPSLGVSRFNPLFARTLHKDTTADAPLIITVNYTQLRLHGEFFKTTKWHAIILDEGQFIKNPASKVARIARELPAEHRLVLTGTPIENRLLDLWSLFAFALPGLLGSQTSFKRHYADDDSHAHARLRARVRHFLLRRTKSQVATDLPARTEEDIIVELEGEQAKLYQAELKRARAQLLRVETSHQLDKVRFNILTSLLRLRQICCHPALIDPSLAEEPSAKLEALLEHVEELRDEGHQVLVFSQFVGMLNIIRDRLVAAGIGHLLLTGQTENRDELVKEFQANSSQTVFLLSLKAAGFGLNLTAASYVIIYDPWWNPAVEAQAIDRTHRIGQTNPVNAYRFIARGTVEEKIRKLQHDKADLAASVVQEESLTNVLDLDSLRQILS